MMVQSFWWSEPKSTVMRTVWELKADGTLRIAFLTRSVITLSGTGLVDLSLRTLRRSWDALMRSILVGADILMDLVACLGLKEVEILRSRRDVWAVGRVLRRRMLLKGYAVYMIYLRENRLYAAVPLVISLVD